MSPDTAPRAQLNSPLPLPVMGLDQAPPAPALVPAPAPALTPAPAKPLSSRAPGGSTAEGLRGLRRYKMINLVGDGTYGLVYLAYNQVSDQEEDETRLLW